MLPFSRHKEGHDARVNRRDQIFRRLRNVGPLLILVATVLMMAGAVLQVRLHMLAKRPVSIAHLATEKQIVTSIREATVELIAEDAAAPFADRLRHMDQDLDRWQSVHRDLVKAARSGIFPEEVQDPLEARVFPLYDDITRTTNRILARHEEQEGRVSPAELRPLVRQLHMSVDAYLFSLDQLELIQRRLTRSAILETQKLEGILIIFTAVAFLFLIFWLYVPATQIIRSLIKRLRISLGAIRRRDAILEQFRKLVDERLQVALDVSNTGTFVWNTDTDELKWDNNLARLYGLEDTENIFHIRDFLDRVHDEDREKVRNHIEKTLIQGHDAVDLRVRADSQVRWLRDRTLVLQSNGTRKVVGACTDETDLMYEIEREHHAREEAESASAVKTQFLASITHDMKTPLTVKDEGRGIEVKRQTLIFEAFSSRNYSTDTYRSTGVGLYISQKLAALLGGDVALIESEVGVGSTFCFTVPVEIPASTELT